MVFRSRLGAAMLVALATVTAANAWVVVSRYRGGAAGVQVDATGNVVAGHRVVLPSGVNGWHVSKRIAATGKQLWLRELSLPEAPSNAAEAPRLLLDGAGDVVLSGAYAGIQHIVKLDGVTGATVWQVQTAIRQIATVADANGDVYTTGGRNDVPSGQISFGVEKRSGATGAVVWAWTAAMAAPYEAEGGGLAVGPDGHVVAVGFVDREKVPPFDGYDSSIAAVKLSAVDGSQLWLHTEDAPLTWHDGLHAVGVDAAGDVVASGQLDGALVVRKLAGASGTPLWTTPVPDAAGPNANPSSAAVRFVDGDPIAIGHVGVVFDSKIVRLDAATGAIDWVQDDATKADRIEIDGGGDLLVGGSRGLEAAVTRVDGATGALVWRAVIDGFDSTFGGVVTAIDAVGAPNFVGVTRNEGEFRPFVGRLSDRITGRTLLVTDSVAKPEKRSLRLDSRDPSIIASAIGSGADPTLVGATLELRNPSSGETATIALPAAGWKASGRGYGGRQYKYKDSGAAGPCRSVTLTSAKRLKIVCRGAGIGFTLDEAAQGELAVRLTIGAGDGFRYCVRFGGAVRLDVPATAGADGRFDARDAVAPEACG